MGAREGGEGKGKACNETASCCGTCSIPTGVKKKKFVKRQHCHSEKGKTGGSWEGERERVVDMVM